MSSKAMGLIEFLLDVRYQILKQRDDFANHRQHCGKQVFKRQIPSEGTCH